MLNIQPNSWSFWIFFGWSPSALWHYRHMISVYGIPVPSRCACTGWLHAPWLTLLYEAPSKDQHMSILFSVVTLLEFLIMGVFVWGVYVWVHTCMWFAGICGSQEASDPLEVLWKSNKCWVIAPVPPKCLLSWFCVLSDSVLSLWSRGRKELMEWLTAASSGPSHFLCICIELVLCHPLPCLTWSYPFQVIYATLQAPSSALVQEQVGKKLGI